MRWLAFLLLAACARDAAAPPEAARAVPHVYTSFYPLTYFAERIGGERVNVMCLLPGDADVIFWMPDAAEIVALQGADLILLNGAGLERWPAKVSLPESRVVRTAAPFRAEWLRYEDAPPHRHGPGEHAHEGVDGHTWLDPILAKAQANEIRKAFGRRLPQYRTEFDARFAALAQDLDALDAALRAIPRRPLAVSHPAYNYVAKRYGWIVDEEKAKHMLWESPPEDDTSSLTAVVFDPCEWPGEGDYLARMHANAKRLNKALD